MNDSRIQYRKIRAPKQHNQFLIDPPLADAANLIQANQQALQNSAPLMIGGLPLLELRQAARTRLIDQAYDYSSRYLPIEKPVHPTLIFLSGHQPKLFHPGVWFKNILLHRLAAAHHATSINLIIDNDLCGEPFIKVPTGSIESPVIEQIAFDTSQANLPFEEAEVQSPELFTSFAQRVTQALLHDVEGNQITSYWEKVNGTDSNNIGLKFSQARHITEAQQGITNLEVPLSSICDTPEFIRFCCHLICESQTLSEIYNRSLLEYRKTHKIRSQSHPVPTLEHTESSIELPLWIWSQGQPTRRRLFCIKQNQVITLLDEDGNQFGKLDFSNGFDDAIKQFHDLSSEGIRIRPRALMTTMYCRLILSDLFLHGIGGGKYDQLTDHIAKQFLGFPLPAFLMATATVKLFPNQSEQPRQTLETIEADLRDIKFSPDKYAQKIFQTGHPSHSSLEVLITKKQQHVKKEVEPADRAAWHAELQGLHDQIRELLKDDQLALQTNKLEAENSLRAFELLDSREFSLVLFNGKTLLDLLVTATNTP